MNEDPFGGLPILDIETDPGGIVARFGLMPWVTPIPGIVPSRNSGDGTSPRKAFYIGGIGHGMVSLAVNEFYSKALTKPAISRALRAIQGKTNS